MLIIDWNNCKNKQLNENIEVSLTNHSKDRMKERDGKILNISKKDIENLINKAEDEIEKYSDKFKSFIIKSTKNGLNIVGSIIKKGKDLIFKVITVMKKKLFIPKSSNDKLIIAESIEKKNNTEIEISKILLQVKNKRNQALENNPYSDKYLSKNIRNFESQLSKKIRKFKKNETKK